MRKLVFRIVAQAPSELGEVKVAEVVIRWSDITGEAVKMHTRTVPVLVNVVPGDEAAHQAVDSEVTEQVVILGAAKARKDARKLADEGDFDGAQQLLADQAEQLSSIPSASAMFAVARDDLEELERFTRRLEMRTYDQMDSKELWDQSRRRNRSEDYRKRPDRP